MLLEAKVGAARKRLSRASNRSGAAFTSAAVLVPLLLLAAVSWWSWETTRRDAHQRVERLAGAIAEHARRVLETQETVLEAALSRVRGMTPETAAADIEVHNFLRRLESHSLSSSATSLIDLRTSSIVATSAAFPPMVADLSRRDYIEEHRRGQGDTTFIGGVVRGAASGRIGFTVSRRDPDSGIVAVTLVPVDGFQSFYQSARESLRDSLTLSREDGVALVIQTAPDPVGFRLPQDAVLMRLLRGEASAPVHAASAVDGVDRVWSHHKVGNYPVYALYGLDHSRIIAGWLGRLAPFALLTFLGSALLLATGIRAQRAIVARQRAEAETEWATLRAEQAEALSAKTQQLESLLTSAPLGVAFFDRQHRYVQINETLAGINGMPARAHIGRSIEDLLPGNAQSVVPVIERVFATGTAIGNLEVSGETPREPGVERHWLTGFYPVRDRTGQVTMVGAWVAEITAAKRAEQALRTSEEQLRLFIEHAPAAIAMLDREMRYLATSRRWREDFRLGDAPLLGRGHYEVLPEVGEQWKQAHRRALAGEVLSSDGEPFQHSDGARRWLAWELRPWTGADGRIGGIMITAQDITERRQREEHVRLLMREVNHRAKNMLAVVQAVARHTARHGDPETFAARLSDRIQGLAASQDLLVNNSWRGVEIGPLVRSQLAHYRDLIGGRVTIEGPDLSVTSSAAQAIGMAVYELGTNAGKYGALSNDTGKVVISWQLNGADFEMRWVEQGGPPVEPPQRRGFGRTVIETMAGAAVGGEARMDHAATGLEWLLRAPARNVLEADGGD